MEGLKLVGSFRNIIGVWRGGGTEPQEREECIILAMRGERGRRISLTKFVSRG